MLGPTLGSHLFLMAWLYSLSHIPFPVVPDWIKTVSTVPLSFNPSQILSSPPCPAVRDFAACCFDPCYRPETSKLSKISCYQNIFQNKYHYIPRWAGHHLPNPPNKSLTIPQLLIISYISSILLPVALSSSSSSRMLSATQDGDVVYCSGDTELLVLWMVVILFRIYYNWLIMNFIRLNLARLAYLIVMLWK